MGFSLQRLVAQTGVYECVRKCVCEQQASPGLHFLLSHLSGALVKLSDLSCSQFMQQTAQLKGGLAAANDSMVPEGNTGRLETPQFLHHLKKTHAFALIAAQF